MIPTVPYGYTRIDRQEQTGSSRVGNAGAVTLLAGLDSRRCTRICRRFTPLRIFKTWPHRSARRGSAPLSLPPAPSTLLTRASPVSDGFTDAGDGQYVSFLVTAMGFEPGPGGRENSQKLIDLPVSVETGDTRLTEVVPVGSTNTPTSTASRSGCLSPTSRPHTSSGNGTTARSHGGGCRTTPSNSSRRCRSSRSSGSTSRSESRPRKRSRSLST